ncbi:MAG: hypothetical protein BWY09_01315 [Candidatus Hydrogenedentes bacterium ADurb.Bin179]|nr:MAG: hypothetical protein BWY09_01315 [Candidatus Hydrogenedentes bacterium ADurb.Bin179]
MVGAAYPLEGGSRRCIVRHAFVRQQARFAAIFPRRNPAAFAHKQRTVFIIPKHLPFRQGFRTGRFLTVFIPVDIHGPHIRPGREMILNHGIERIGLVVGLFLVYGLNAEGFGFSQFQREEGRIHDMAGHVAQAAATEIPPAAPFKRSVQLVIGAHGRRAHPQVPAQRRRHRFFGRRRLWRSLGPAAAGPVRPDMDFPHGANGSAPNHFRQFPDAVPGVPLVAHLRGHAHFTGGLRQQARLGHGMGKGLFNIHMLAEFHGQVGRRGMGMVRRRDGNHVDIFAHLIEHFPVVLVAFRVRKKVKGLFGAAGIHIAQGNDVFLFIGHDILCALAAHTDAGDIEFFIRGYLAGNNPGRVYRLRPCAAEQSRCGGRREKSAAGKGDFRHSIFSMN